MAGKPRSPRDWDLGSPTKQRSPCCGSRAKTQAAEVGNKFKNCKSRVTVNLDEGNLSLTLMSVTDLLCDLVKVTFPPDVR